MLWFALLQNTRLEVSVFAESLPFSSNRSFSIDIFTDTSAILKTSTSSLYRIPGGPHRDPVKNDSSFFLSSLAINPPTLSSLMNILEESSMFDIKLNKSGMEVLVYMTILIILDWRVFGEILVGEIRVERFSRR